MSLCCYGSTAARQSWERICGRDLDTKLAARKRRFQCTSATVGCQTDISLMMNSEFVQAMIDKAILKNSQVEGVKLKFEEQPDDVIVAMFQYMKS
jgi:hypothetical protein